MSNHFCKQTLAPIVNKSFAKVIFIHACTSDTNVYIGIHNEVERILSYKSQVKSQVWICEISHVIISKSFGTEVV